MLSLRDDQETVVKTVIDRLFSTDKAKVLLTAPTGWGKTVAFCWLAKHCASIGQTVAILAHRSELIHQISRTLRELDVSHGTVRAGEKHRKDCAVHVASVQTLARRLDSFIPPDIAIIDEAHHAVANTTWGKILSAWPNSLRLGVTATPQRLSGEGLGELFNELIHGPTVADLMASGTLSKFRIFAPSQIDTRRLRVRAGDFSREDLSDALNKPVIIGDAVDHYRRLAHGKRAIVFCVSVQHAVSTANAFNAAGYSAESIDGAMDYVRRFQLIERFRSGNINVLTSCDLVSEGFDLPAIEVAILLRPTMSLALYLQQVGRALRPYPGKDYALILDHAGNTMRHGFPDDPREWSLQGRERKKTDESEQSINVRLCGQCFAACRAPVSVCPHCGYVWPAKPRRVEEAEGELQEVVRSERHIAMRREQGMAIELNALIELGKRRGYKNPQYWARCVWESRAMRRGQRERTKYPEWHPN